MRRESERESETEAEGGRGRQREGKGWFSGQPKPWRIIFKNNQLSEMKKKKIYIYIYMKLRMEILFEVIIRWPVRNVAVVFGCFLF